MGVPETDSCVCDYGIPRAKSLERQRLIEVKSGQEKDPKTVLELTFVSCSRTSERGHPRRGEFRTRNARRASSSITVIPARTIHAGLTGFPHSRHESIPSSEFMPGARSIAGARIQPHATRDGRCGPGEKSV